MGASTITLRGTLPDKQNPSPLELGSAGASVQNVGPQTVYYRDELPVTASANDGSIAANGSVSLSGTQYVVVDEGAAASAQDVATLLINPVAQTSGNSVPTDHVTLASYPAIKGDCKTITDATIAGGSLGNLTSAANPFTSGDVGKTIVINAAGTVLTATTTSALGTGGAITSIPVSALAAAIPAGGVTIVSGGNSQTFATAGAALNATTIPVDSLTPNFAYPSGSVISQAAQPHKTTIASFVGAGEITLTTAAVTAVTGVEATYGTNNFTAIQQAINDAITAGVRLHIPSAGEGYLYDGELVCASSLDITGGGVRENWGTATTSLNVLNLPGVAPYVKGAVLVQAAKNTNGLRFTGIGTSNSLEKFAIRFAGRFNSTGHGIVIDPPDHPTVATTKDHGLMSAHWRKLTIYGHDGNHYAYVNMNSMYSTFDSLHSYGGGFMEFNQNSGVCSYGNTVFIHPYGCLVAAGSAHVMSWRNRTTVGSQKLNYGAFVRPQFWHYTFAPAVPGVTPPRAAQRLYTTMDSANGTVVQTMSIMAPDFETSGTGIYGPMGGVSQMMAGGSAGPTSVKDVAGATSGFGGTSLATTYQNNAGATALWMVTVDLTSSVGASATATLGISKQSNYSPSFVQAEETIPAGVAQTVRRTLTCVVPTTNTAQVNGTNVTVVRSQVQFLTGAQQ